jgi:hypothetical protein
VPVHAGVNRIEIRFVQTWDRVLGEWISIVTALLIFAWFIWLHRRENRKT